MKKVLFINPSLCQGGREQTLITMLRLLDKTEYDLTLFTYSDDMTLLPLVPKEVKVVTDKKKPHYHRKLKAVFYKSLIAFSKILKLKKLCEKTKEKLRIYIHSEKAKHPAKDIFRNDKFDVVIANAEGFTSEIAGYINTDKRYFYYHNSIDMNHSFLEKIFLKYDKIIAVSNGVKDMLCSSYSGISEKVQVIENYVDAQKIIEKSTAQLPFQKDDKLVFCTCGRLSEEKGFDLAVEAAHILKEKGVDFVWYFVSDGKQRQKIEKLIDDYSLNENIVITGYVENPFPYYKLCDVYIQPSYHESFGLTMKEALVLQKLVVSTNTVGGQTVLKNGEYGEIVDVSAERIADGIIASLKKDEQGLYKKYDIQENEKEKQLFIEQFEALLQS